MEVITTLLAVLTVLLAAFLIPLHARVSAKRKQDIDALKALVEERSRYVEERSHTTDERSRALGNMLSRLDALDERDAEHESASSEGSGKNSDSGLDHPTTYFVAPNAMMGSMNLPVPDRDLVEHVRRLVTPPAYTAYRPIVVGVGGEAINSVGGLINPVGGAINTLGAGIGLGSNSPANHFEISHVVPRSSALGGSNPLLSNLLLRTPMGKNVWTGIAESNEALIGAPEWLQDAAPRVVPNAKRYGGGRLVPLSRPVSQAS